MILNNFNLLPSCSIIHVSISSTRESQCSAFRKSKSKVQRNWIDTGCCYKRWIKCWVRFWFWYDSILSCFDTNIQVTVGVKQITDSVRNGEERRRRGEQIDLYLLPCNLLVGLNNYKQWHLDYRKTSGTLLPVIRNMEQRKELMERRETER